MPIALSRSLATNPSQNQPQQPISVRDLVIWKARQTSFEKFGEYWFAPMNLSTEEGRPERFSGGLLTVDAFEALGVRAYARPRISPGRRSSRR